MQLGKWTIGGRVCGRLLLMLSVVGCGVASVANSAEPDEAAFADDLRQVLLSGLNRSIELKEVGRQIESMSDPHSDEPGLRYAYGLILQNRLHEKEAAIQFQSAIRTDQSFGPAWQSLIKIRLADKAADNLCDDLVALAEALANSKHGWRPTERHELAGWLGRVHGFLALDEVDFVPVSSLDHNVAIVHRRLPQVLHSDYEAGRQQLAADYDARLSEVELAIASDESKAAQKRANDLNELKERAQDVKQKAETAALTQEQWVSWLTEQLSTTEKRLKELQQDYEKLDAADRKLTNLSLQTQLDRNRLQTEYGLQGLAANDIARQPGVIRLDQEMLRYSAERQSLQQQASRVMATARAVALARVAATRRYEEATGDIRKADAVLTRWTKAIKRSTLEVKERSASNGKRTRLIKRLSLPSTYFEVDEKVCAERLLRTLGTSLAEKSKP